jgi:methyl-accepting chemotaxis protein
MRGLQQFTIKSRLTLLVGLFIAGFVGFGAMAYRTLDTLKVHGPFYQRIVQGKDVIADVLPPPKYIIESYLVTLQMLDESSPEGRQRLAHRFANLKAEYETRQGFWMRELPEGQLRDMMVQSSDTPAMEFFRVAEEQFIPAVLEGNGARARSISRRALKPLYEEHRAVVDKIVKLAMARTREEELATGTLIHSRTAFLVLFGVLVLGGVSLFTWANARQITGSLDETVHVLESVAGGDLGQVLAIDSKDEIGRMATALNETVTSLRNAFHNLELAKRREAAQANDLRAKVDEILAAVRAAAHGDLTQRVGVTGTDAIGQLGDGLNQFFETMRGNVATLAQNAERLARASTQLSDVSEQMSVSAEETSSQAGAATSAAQKVSASVRAVATVTEQVTAATQEIARSTVEAAEVGGEAVKVAATTNQMIAKLDASSAEIGKVMELITSIAKKVNLLALNATIEAARAGEAGKGFAVVAGEVKELARQTSKATGDVRRRIAAIQADSREAVDAIAEIGTIIHQINDIQTKIAHAAEEQATNTSTIGAHVAAATTNSREIARSTIDVAQFAEGTTTGAGDTRQAANELSRMASELQRLVSQFRIDAQCPGRSVDPRPGAPSEPDTGHWEPGTAFYRVVGAAAE